MIGACFIYRVGLGALDEGGVGEPGGEAVALLRRGGKRLAQPVALGGEVDHAFERDGERLAPDDELRRRAGRRRIEADRFEPREEVEMRRQLAGEIGSASSRESGCQYEENTVVR